MPLTHIMNQMKLTLTLCLILCVTACGGGGSSSAPAPASAPVQTTTSTSTSSTTSSADAVSLTAMAVPALTAADCTRLQSDAVAQSTLNLADPQIAKLNTFIKAIDPDFSWKMFIRAPEEWVRWALDGATSGTLDMLKFGTASHEVHHYVRIGLTRNCSPINNYKVYFNGTTYSTTIVNGALPAYGVVDTVLPAALKTGSRYQGYIVNLGSAPGNGFHILMDELAAYTGDALSDVRWAASQSTPTVTLNSGLGGTIDFMAYAVAYLQAVRTSNPGAWATINGDTQLKAALQAIWTKAEENIALSYPLTKTSPFNLGYNPAAFDYVYSPAALNELSLLGITTRSRASWVGTYL